MTALEWLLKGKKKCDCEDVELIISKRSFKTEKTRSNDNFQNLVLNTLHGVNYNKGERVVYSAYCSKCNKLYLSYNKKKDLIDAINKLKHNNCIIN